MVVSFIHTFVFAECFFNIFPNARGVSEFAFDVLTLSDADFCVEVCYDTYRCEAATYYYETQQCYFYDVTNAYDFEGCNDICEDSDHFVLSNCLEGRAGVACKNNR